MSLGIFQRVVPEYRTPIFERLADEHGFDVTIYSTRFDRATAKVTAVPVREVAVGGVAFHPAVLTGARRRKHDAIICEGAVGQLTSAFLVLGQSRHQVPVVWWSSLWQRNGRIGPGAGVRGALTKLMLRRAAAVVTYSSAAAKEALACGARANRVFVAPNSLDSVELEKIERSWRSDETRLSAHPGFRELSQVPVAAFVGRLTESKRVNMLLDAWRAVSDKLEYLRPILLIAGDGPSRASLEDQASRLGIEKRVLFVGEVRDANELCPYLLAARAVIMPGTGGLVVNHALSHGVPVIAARGDGTERDLVDHGRNGFLVSGCTAAELVEPMVHLLTCEQQTWQGYSDRARHVIREGNGIRAMLRGLAAAVTTAVEAKPA